MEMFCMGIEKKESLTVEFKSDRKRLSDSVLVDAVVAMANTEGGVIYEGIEDDGTVTGVHPAHKDAPGLCAMVANKTLPSVRVCSELVDVEGTTVMKVTVPVSPQIVATSDGRVLKRRLKENGEPENVPMYPFEMLSRLGSLSAFDYSAQVLPDETFESLDVLEIRRMRNIISMRQGDGSLLSLGDEDLCKALQLVRDVNGVMRPTVAGLLLVGKADRLTSAIPTAGAVFQVMEGSSVRMNEDLSLPLLATFEDFEKWLKGWNPQTELEYGLLRIPVSEFSPDAFREALVNAFCHRDYTKLDRVRVCISDEGLSITSPGGFIEGVTVDNLLTVEPRGRNPLLCDIFKRLGLCERTGRGIDRIFESSIIYGKILPDYGESNSAYVRVVFPRSLPDVKFAAMIYDEESRTNRKMSIYSLLVLSTLRSQRRCSLDELEDMTHLSPTTLRSSIERLVESGLVEARGNSRNREYMLGEKVYKKSGVEKEYSLQKADDADLQAVLALVSGKGSVSRGDVMDALSVNAGTASGLLSKLVGKGLLERTGKTKGIRYTLADKSGK